MRCYQKLIIFIPSKLFIYVIQIVIKVRKPLRIQGCFWFVNHHEAHSIFRTFLRQFKNELKIQEEQILFART